MREGSYMEIRPGMKVYGAGGESVGTVEQVIADEASGIFLDADSVSSTSKHLAWSRCAKPILPQSLEGSSCSRHIFCSKRADSPKAVMNLKMLPKSDSSLK